MTKHEMPFFERPSIDEIADHDEVFMQLRARMHEIEAMIADGRLQYGSDEQLDLCEALEDEWPYTNRLVDFIGRLRPVAECEDDNILYDQYGPYIVPEENLALISQGCELIPVNDEGGVRYVYCFSAPGAGKPEYYCVDEDMMRCTFNFLPSASLRWQLERLAPDAVAQIDAIAEGNPTLADRIRRLQHLTLEINIPQYGDYPIINVLERLLNETVAIDHRVMHNVTIQGAVEIETPTADGQDFIRGELDDSFVTSCFVDLIKLAEVNDAGQYTPIMGLYLHTDEHGAENDETISLAPEAIVDIASVRPAISLGNALRQNIPPHGAVAVQPEAIEIEVADDRPEESVGDSTESRTPYQELEFYQTLLNGCKILGDRLSEKRYETQEAAFAAANEVMTTIEQLLGEDFEHIRELTFIASGLGITLANYTLDGRVPDSHDVAFQLDDEAYVQSDVSGDMHFIQLDSFASQILGQAQEDGTIEWRAVIEVMTHNVQIRQFVQCRPNTERPLRTITVTDHLTLAMDSRTDLELVTVYDMRRFVSMMEKFERKLIEMPDLTASYEACSRLKNALMGQATDKFEELRHVEWLQLLGEQGSGDSEASEIIVDTLAELFGKRRIIEFTGPAYYISNASEEINISACGVIADVVSMMPGGTTEEPMLVLVPINGNERNKLFVPLSSIERFSF